MIRPTSIDLSPVELKYYPFMISLDVVSSKICAPKINKRRKC